MHDAGNGTITLVNADLMCTLLLGASLTCPYHLKIGSQDALMRIGSLRIRFQSAYAFLYDSVMGLLTDTLIGLFNEKLSA